MHQAKIVILNGETLYKRMGYDAIFICVTVRVVPSIVASQVPDHTPAHPVLVSTQPPDVLDSPPSVYFRRWFRCYPQQAPNEQHEYNCQNNHKCAHGIHLISSSCKKPFVTTHFFMDISLICNKRTLLRMIN